MTRCLCALLFVATAATAETVTLATGGRPHATIVLPDKAPERLAFAAADLQQYVRKLCGVELPIRKDGQAVEGPGLYLGDCVPTQPADRPAADLNPESYAIRVRDGNVFFAGRYPTPAAFAVYAFLEEDLGVRWFAPGEMWEYVPRGTPGELTVNLRPRVSVPATSPRVWSGHGWTPDWTRWSLRNKAVLSEVVPRRQFQNNLFRVFPPEKYAKEHPEYYPLIDGKRWIPAAGDVYWRPCESNPEVLRLTAEYARRQFDTKPEIDSFSVGMDDVSHLCGCANCRAWDATPDGYEKKAFSDRHYKFVNALAREIAKTHPDKYIGTLIYAIAKEPPVTVPKLEPNVFGFITETAACWYDPERQAYDRQITDAWVQRAKHLSRYDYHGFASITPRYFPHHLAEQFQYDKERGLEGQYLEVYTVLPHTLPMVWACARMQWSWPQDIDRLLDECFTKLFGPAAGSVAKYYDLLERSYNQPRPGRGVWEHRNLINQALAISPEAVDEGLALLDQALREADSDAIRQRIGTIRAALEYGGYAVKTYALAQSLSATAVTDAAAADRVLTGLESLAKLAQAREQSWAAAPDRPDLFGEAIRGLTRQGYLVTGQIARLEQGGTTAALNLLAWAAANAPAKLAEIADRLATAAPHAGVAATARAWLWVSQQRPATLAVNPGFEDRRPNEAPAEHDWQTKGAPAGWSTWDRTNRSQLGVRAGAGREQSAAAFIRGAEAATFLQDVKAKPGERYLAVVWARGSTAQKGRPGYLTIRYRQPGGGWHARRDLEQSVDLPPGDGWQPLVLLVTIPEGAGSLVLMLGAQSQTGADEVLYDDVGLYRLP